MRRFATSFRSRRCSNLILGKPTEPGGNGNRRCIVKARSVSVVLTTERRIARRVSPSALILTLDVAAGRTSWLSTTTAESQRLLEVMTRNMDEGTDLDFVLNGTAVHDLLNAVADTYLEVAASNIP